MHAVLPLLALAGAASAAVLPTKDTATMKRDILRRLSKRQSVTTGAGDDVILNFALTLEHLEARFYHGALEKFNATDFADAGYEGVYPVLEQVGKDETAHVEFLTTAIGAAGLTPVEACNYTFPYTDVKSFLALSQVIEGTGVSAYLGAAADIETSAYLTAAASILTVEARHAAFFQALHGYQPASQPNDTPLSAANIVTIVSPFFTSCPNGSAPAIEGNPALNVTTAAPAINGTLEVRAVNSSAVENWTGAPVYCGFASGLGAAFSTWNNGSCTIPSQNVTEGQAYVLLTSGPSLNASSILAGPAILTLGSNNLTYTVGASNATAGNSSTPANNASKATAAGAMSGTSGATSVKMGAGAILLAVGTALLA